MVFKTRVSLPQGSRGVQDSADPVPCWLQEVNFKYKRLKKKRWESQSSGRKEKPWSPHFLARATSRGSKKGTHPRGRAYSPFSITLEEEGGKKHFKRLKDKKKRELQSAKTVLLNISPFRQEFTQASSISVKPITSKGKEYKFLRRTCEGI